VPDQLRRAVKTPHRYEPEINATFAEMARHYATAVVPARLIFTRPSMQSPTVAIFSQVVCRRMGVGAHSGASQALRTRRR
jgi:hypothetical protein